MKNLFTTLAKTLGSAAVVAAGVSAANAQDGDLVVKGNEQKNGAVCYNWPTLREKEVSGMITLTAGGTTRICADPAGVIVTPLDPKTIFNTEDVICVVHKREAPSVALPAACPAVPGLTLNK